MLSEYQIAHVKKINNYHDKITITILPIYRTFSVGNKDCQWNKELMYLNIYEDDKNDEFRKIKVGSFILISSHRKSVRARQWWSIDCGDIIQGFVSLLEKNQPIFQDKYKTFTFLDYIGRDKFKKFLYRLNGKYDNYYVGSNDICFRIDFIFKCISYLYQNPDKLKDFPRNELVAKAVRVIQKDEFLGKYYLVDFGRHSYVVTLGTDYYKGIEEISSVDDIKKSIIDKVNTNEKQCLLSNSETFVLNKFHDSICIGNYALYNSNGDMFLYNESLFTKHDLSKDNINYIFEHFYKGEGNESGNTWAYDSYTLKDNTIIGRVHYSYEVHHISDRFKGSYYSVSRRIGDPLTQNEIKYLESM